MNNYNCIVVLGPTACGKTKLACNIAFALNGEIISADSRQVYRLLNIGTGKDLQEYNVNGQKINYHLIDVCEPMEQFYLHQFIELSEKAFHEINFKNKLPVICGGTGLYLDSLRKDFSYTQIKENPASRKELEAFSREELEMKLKKFPGQFTRHTDIHSKKRIIRAIEVAKYLMKNPAEIVMKKKPFRPFYIGINVDVEERKKLISDRLADRMNTGLIEEVETLLRNGITHWRLENLGLEYKYVSLFLRNNITKDELILLLRTAIFQFAKRQMTWFRKLEKEGVEIKWIKKEENEILISNLKSIFSS